MIKWNKNDWQGKRKRQVDYSNGITFVVMTLTILLLITLWIFSLTK